MEETQTQEAGELAQDTTSEVENSEAVENIESEQSEQATNEKPPIDPQKKLIPLAAVREERERNKKLAEELRQTNERTRVMEERFQQFTQAMQQRLQPQRQEPEIPDVNVDAVGHFRARTEALERQLQQLAAPVQDMRQQAAQQEQYSRLQNHVASQEAAFAKETPDYPDAMKYMKELSFRGVKALGYSDQQAAALVNQEYAKLAYNVASQHGNVAMHVYELALANGYQRAQEQQQSGQEQIQNLQKGVKAAKSLGSGGGTSQRLSLAALAEMPADEFSKTIGDEDAWRKLWGA